MIDPAWYCVRTKPRREGRAVDSLTQIPAIGEVFAPQLLTLGHGFTKNKRVLVPLFPTYLFAYLTLAEAIVHLRRAIGVQDRPLLTFEGRPQVVPAEVITQVRSELIQDPFYGWCVLDKDVTGTAGRSASLTRGQRVRVDLASDSAWAGREGTFQELDGKKRVWALFEMIRVSLERSEVEPV